MYLHQDQGGLWLTEKERENLKISYRIKDIIFQQNSPFQHVMILDTYDFGAMLVLDGVVQTTSMDGHIYNEMIAHIPLTFHPDPRKVLIIGGGDCGAAREACKYPQVDKIDMVEIDQLVVEACLNHLPAVSGRLSDPRVRFVYGDGVEFARQSKEVYDVIIVDSSDPVGPAKQLFELEFYRNLRGSLKPGGIMVCQSQSPIFHADVMAQTYHRINSLFAHTYLYSAVVPTYPGGMWSFTLGSKAEVDWTRTDSFDKPAAYVNNEVLKSCFRLPQFLADELQNRKSVNSR